MLVGVASLPPSLIPALQNVGILHHKKAKLPKHLQQSVLSKKIENCGNYSIFLQFPIKKRTVSAKSIEGNIVDIFLLLFFHKCPRHLIR